MESCDCDTYGSFDVAGGSAVSNQMVVHEGKAGQPTPAPTKAGYTFGAGIQVMPTQHHIILILLLQQTQ